MLKDILKKILFFSQALWIMMALIFFASCHTAPLGKEAAIENETSGIRRESEKKIEDAREASGNMESDGVPLPQDEANGIDIADGLAFVADHMGGLIVFDISDKSNPLKIAEISLSGDAMHILAAESLAYAACGFAGLQIIDISNIEDMRIISSFVAEGSSNYYASRLQLKENTLFMADAAGGLKIIDVSIPEKPELLSTFASTNQGSIEDVLVESNAAFLADYRAGLVIVDISDLKNPRLISETRTSGMPYGLCKVEDKQGNMFILLADYNKGMKIIDVSDLSKPFIVGQYDQPKNAVSIAAKASTAFIADYHLGTIQIDITDLKEPLLVKTFDSGKTNDVFIHESHVFAASDKGFLSFKFQ